MKCFHPIKVRGQLVPCGRCAACQVNYSEAWKIRLTEEYKNCDLCLWLTLQYDDFNVPHTKSNFLTLSKSDVKQFFNSLRVFHTRHDNITLKYFLCAEYGSHTFRPHYHTLIFYYGLQQKSIIEQVDFKWRELERIRERFWTKGCVVHKDFHNGVCGYVTKYVTKPQPVLLSDEPLLPFRFISRGIGISLLNKLDFEYAQENLDFSFTYNGKKRVLPRYYQNKIAPHKGEVALLNECALHQLSDEEFKQEISKTKDFNNKVNNFKKDSFVKEQILIKTKFNDDYSFYNKHKKGENSVKQRQFDEKLKKRLL